jgi:hypothetical protein
MTRNRGRAPTGKSATGNAATGKAPARSAPGKAAPGKSPSGKAPSVPPARATSGSPPVDGLPGSPPVDGPLVEAPESEVAVAAWPGAPSSGRGSRIADLMLRIMGALVGLAGGLVTAVLEVFLSPLRVGTVRLPASILLAVIGNLVLVWYTHRATSHRGAALLPGAAWFVVMVLAAGRTSEGDLLLTGDNWVGLVTIFAGTIAFALAAYRLILPRRSGSL